MKFYICEHCGNIITKLSSTGVPIKCCGQDMVELKAGVKEASLEKHVPVVTVEGNLVKVSVGSVAHPMTEEHYIPWVALETEQGNQRKTLKPGEKPEVTFAITEGDKVIAAYEYCNLHGLWMGK